MKPYKKYGDIYHMTKQVRSCLKNKPHGTNENLYDFWTEQMKSCLHENQFDLMCTYCAMTYLGWFIESQPRKTYFPEANRIWFWKNFVRAFRGSYKF